jgi:hypothetical protein
MAETLFRLRADDLTWRAVDGEIMILDARGWSYLSVNRTGERLWLRIADGATRADLEAELVDAHGLDPVRAREDVVQFLSQLREHGLLESGSSAHPSAD